MLVNLMPPIEGIALRDPAIVVSPEKSARGFVVVHPRYRSWLAKCGLHSADDILALDGEIVSGHPNRHVLQVNLKTGSITRRLYLKREHSVGWRSRLKNWRDGFGFVSRSEREAKVLERLEAAGLPGPHGIAYGEDGRGRAFLLVDELTGCQELRVVLADPTISPADRRSLADHLGKAIADLHAAGFDTPDLSAKHVFVRPGSWTVTLLDWPSAKPGRMLEPAQRWDALACLNASLVDWLATPRERLRAIRAYRKRSREIGEFAPFARMVGERTARWLKRSSIRSQRQPGVGRHDQRLVWLADESVCAHPEIAKHWPRPAAVDPYYSNETVDGERLRVAAPDGRPATLLRFRTTDPIGRTVAALRGKAWRSPAARLARLTFHLQNAGVPVPRLLAFGQRFTTSVTADSFLLASRTDAPTLLDWIARHPHDREALLLEYGGILRLAHEAGCVLGPDVRCAAVQLDRGRPRLVVDPSLHGRLLKSVAEPLRRADLTSFEGRDRELVLEGYTCERTTA
jgi:hypothetical protein